MAGRGLSPSASTAGEEQERQPLRIGSRGRERQDSLGRRLRREDRDDLAGEERAAVAQNGWEMAAGGGEWSSRLARAPARARIQ